MEYDRARTRRQESCQLFYFGCAGHSRGKEVEFMKFVKMNGAGNDFIILDNRVEQLTDAQLSNLAKIVCHRHLSIGADGLMAVDHPEQGGDYKMLFFNSDGSAGEMCGNGARCICRYGYEFGLAGQTQTIETPAGMVTGRRLNDPTTIRLDAPVQQDGRTYPCSYVELGNPGLPHAVVEMPGLAQMRFDDLRELGRALRWNKAFPKGANVNFFDLVGEDLVVEKTFERGVEDFTYACGTGTGSVVTALTLMGRVSGQGVRVQMAGGELVIDVERDGERVTDLYLTGPTNLVCQGEITDEELAEKAL